MTPEERKAEDARMVALCRDLASKGARRLDVDRETARALLEAAEMGLAVHRLKHDGKPFIYLRGTPVYLEPPGGER